MARVKDAVDLDPAHATDGLSLNVTSEIIEGLVDVQARDLRRHGRARASLDASPDGTRWTFTAAPAAYDSPTARRSTRRR